VQFKRLIDLSHTIVPETGSRPVHLEMVPPPDFGYFPEDQWYIMNNVAFLDHVGTHIEVPYHVVEQGEDLAAVPLERLCGEAVILDLTSVETGADITLSTIQKAAEDAGGMKDGDIVFCRFDFDKHYDKSERPKAPCFTAESVQWLVDKGMKMTGQRRIIARVLSESTDHPHVEEVYRRSVRLDPRISIATVYRTVRLFEEANILSRHEFGDGRARYERAPESHHDHLIDIKSGKVIEFENEEIIEPNHKANKKNFRFTLCTWR